MLQPKETELISQAGGFFKPDEVAKNMVIDMEVKIINVVRSNTL